MKFVVLLALLLASCTQRTPERKLRVCADPNNLPFSNERGEGFENRIAEVLARDLKVTLEYTVVGSAPRLYTEYPHCGSVRSDRQRTEGR